LIELPEALNLSRQINDTVSGRMITDVTVEQTPHKLAWYYGDKNRYSELLVGRTVEGAEAHAGLVEIKIGGSNVLFGDGVNIRYHGNGEQRPQKHQLLIELDDGSAISAVVQMYGGLGAFTEGEMENPYYLAAKQRPSPYSDAFDLDHFRSIISGREVQKLSLKALLATEQRIPGLGNGVLQDILFNSKMHPKRKVSTMTEKDAKSLFQHIKATLTSMADEGGRDTESDLFGRPGGYRTIMSKKTVNGPCPVCGGPITKEAYMGGTVYYCARCQSL